MAWSQDVLIFLLFPYLLPSLPICRNEFWSKDQIRSILEHLLLFYCNITMEKIQKLLQAFVRRVLSISSSCNRNLDHDLYFLADIENRCSFTNAYQWKSSTYSLYACSFLIENKVNIHKDDDFALQCASNFGHKNVVALLLKHNANVHAGYDCVLRWASLEGDKDIVALVLEYKADVHAECDIALQWASCYGHKDIVAILLEHKADVHANEDDSLRWASYCGYKDIVAVLLEHKADVHAKDNWALRCASECGHKDTVALLLEYKASSS
jgi:ankyrin repeat protein